MIRARPAAILLPLAGLLAAACRTGPPVTEAGLRRARAERDRLSARLGELAARDTLASEALAQTGDLLMGVRTAKVEEIVREVARRYLDRVVLDLALETRLEESGDVRVKALLWKLNAGRWTLDLVVHRVTGMLEAGPPRVAAAGRRSLGVELPVTVREGSGTATVAFAWDARSLASVACRDFKTRQRLQGLVLSDDYTVKGEFRLSPGREALRAEPHFPERRFRLRLDLTPESWKKVRATLEEQDQLLKCGVALDPDRMLGMLRRKLSRGFMIRLPPVLFRPVEFPAAIRRSVAVEGSEVSLSLTTSGLAITPQAAWYAVRVETGDGAIAAPPL